MKKNSWKTFAISITTIAIVVMLGVMTFKMLTRPVCSAPDTVFYPERIKQAWGPAIELKQESFACSDKLQRMEINQTQTNPYILCTCQEKTYKSYN